jgi:hypothetical protein
MRVELQGLLEALGAVMDVAGKSRFGADALYSPESAPSWLADPDGFAIAAAAAARTLQAMRPPPDASVADDAEYVKELAETNRAYGAAVAERILRRVASGESADQRTLALRAALGSLVDRINVPANDPRAEGFDHHWVRPMTREQRERHEARLAESRKWEADTWPDDDVPPRNDDAKEGR